MTSLKLSQTHSVKSETPHVVSYEENGSAVHVAIDGKYRGSYLLASALRPEAERLAAGCMAIARWPC